MSSEDRFGFEWERYSEIDPNYETQFRKWVYPLQEGGFRDKKILDAGCGMGRNSFWPLKWGAREVVAFDFDERSIKAAHENLKNFSNARIEFKSIYDIGYKDEFDLAFSIGVIHHLEKPKEAIKNMISAVKPGGKVLIWVYGYEGNEWIVKLVSPIRKAITSRLPVGLVHFLSYFLSAPVWTLAKIFKGPGPYLKQLACFKFWHVHSIVFDQLIPKIANYWTKDEALSLLADFCELGDIKIYQVNKNSWTVIGTKEQKTEAEVNAKLRKECETTKMRKKYDDFKEWNEEMLKKFDLEHYHDNANFIVRFIEGRRVKWILKFLEAKSNDKVLEVGCGAGDILDKVEARERVGLDISDYILEIGKKRYQGIKFVKGDAEDLPEEIKKDKYDKVFVSEVLEHVENPSKVLGQMREVARNDSVIVVSIPNEKLINKIKSILQKLRVFNLFFPKLSRKMDEEWHLHVFDLDKLKKLVDNKFAIFKIRGIPYDFLPLRYVVKLRIKN